MEILKEVYNTNLFVDETIRLLSSMVNSGETHSETSKRIVEDSLKMLSTQRKEIDRRVQKY